MAKIKFTIIMFAIMLLAACVPPQVQQANISVTINADNETHTVQLAAGSTVQEALQTESIGVNPLDRVVPPIYTVLSNGDTVRLIRVIEEFETQTITIPFEHSELRSESLPEGEARLIQTGQNGIKELTIRRVVEDGIEVSNSIVKETIIQSAVPEIVLVGVQAPFVPILIPGKIAYLAAGNAWLMEISTAIRKPLVITGDLDGQIFQLSPNGEWLLFSRKSDKPKNQEINTLWVVNVTDKNAVPISLGASNIIHFAEFIPGKETTITFSTVEPRSLAPGWQANNDLFSITFYANGDLTAVKKILDKNSGGIYGWWGTNFQYSPDGSRIAFSRPDGVGFVDTLKGTLIPLMDITPYNTHSDWAWIPGIAWGADSQTLFVVDHASPQGLISAEDSPLFSLLGISIKNTAFAPLTNQVGMFASPSSSSLRKNGPELEYYLAFMEALFPAQSDTSRYQLVVMDHDGSNRQVLFPEEGMPGLTAQTPVWAPEPYYESGDFIAVIYQGNLWLIDIITKKAEQVSGDGLISKIDWK